MTSKSPVRSCDDVDEQALSYAEIKALCAGDPQIKEKMDLDVDVARLKVLKADHQSQQYRLEDKLMKYFPAEIEKTQGFIKGFQSDIRTVAAHPLPEEGFCGMEVNGTRFTEKAEAGEAILAICKANQSLESVPLGSYRGFKMELAFDSFQKEYQVLLKGELSLQHAELRVDVVELFGRCGPVPEQVFHTLPFGALLGDLLAQRGGLFGDVGSGGGDRGALALELPALQGELQGVDAADGPIRPEPVAQLCVEREDASGGFG